MIETLGQLGALALARDLGEKPGTDRFAAVSAALAVGFAEGWHARCGERVTPYYVEWTEAREVGR